MYLSNNIYSKQDNLQKYKSARKITTKVQVYQLFTKHTQSESEPGNHHDRFAVAVLQGEYAVGHIPRVFQGCLVLPETWRRDHLRNHWHFSKCHVTFDVHFLEQCQTGKATTVTKEFSKCHSWWWWLCPFPRIVPTGFYETGDGHKRLVKVPHTLLKMPRNISWIVSITVIDLILRQKFISWNFYESNLRK